MGAPFWGGGDVPVSGSRLVRSSGVPAAREEEASGQGLGSSVRVHPRYTSSLWTRTPRIASSWRSDSSWA
jgi:hypothetical protein